jgi:ABC-2 type transport system permease protein
MSNAEAWEAPRETKSWLLEQIARFPGQCLALTEVECRKLLRDPTDLLTRSVQPVLWLVIFGNVFSRLRAVPTGALSYLDFMTPGIAAQGVLFLAIFYGIGVIWERDFGVTQKLLVSPAPRIALVLGKALSAGIRAVVHAALIYVLALILGVHVAWGARALLGVAAVIVMGAMTFSTFSLIVACLVKSRERFMGIGQLLTMPLFFASNAIYPIDLMPGWLKLVAHINPLTYQVDALRALMIRGGQSHFGLQLDFVVLAASFTLLLVLGARIYANLVK